MDEAPAPEESDAPALPINSSGELTPAQRARLGLDIYGDDPAPTPVTNGNGNGNGSPPAAPSNSHPTEFGFSEIDPFVEPDLPSTPEPRLAPVRSTPQQSAATPAAAQVRQPARKQSIDERDGTPQMDRDRKVLTYGVSWTFFCLFVTAAISFSSIFANTASGPTPGTFVPAMVSILIGWVIVFVARNMGPNWGWLMLIPAVILVLGPFFYTSWRLGQLQNEARAYLSTGAAESGIDIDASTIVSETINTPQGCFAFTKIRDSGDVTIDVVTYAPATAQQQATMALTPRFARRVEPGGTRANQRTFTLENGTLPVVVEERLSPPIDCANAGGL
ncbi:MAG: hypothetical protein JHD02_10190 [Thermoleophilaceae bacterium]|nr:hypothetical protein [Thermoleophilaceae bacterium]